MNKSLSVVALLSLTFAGQAIAQDATDAGWYVGVDIGEALSHDGEARFEGTTVDTYGALPNFELDDSNVVIGGVVGYDFAGPLRAGVEVRNRDFDTAGGYLAATGNLAGDFAALKGEVESTTLMLTGYYDFNAIGNVQPYAKAGLGAAFNNASATSSYGYNNPIWAGTSVDGTTVTGVSYPGDSNTELAWEVGGGLAMPLTDRLLLDVGYQYVDAGESETGVNSDGDLVRFDDLAAHEATLGLRFKF